ncbi:MAG TPA: WD40 repeat domain-containing serine/threonine-protein kinase, partial [Verrucomicrobiae bacterium]|nr:WD40 repeat domain-containing serine/threonine-protein kinase [Verrucomicrobiae bacterium]
RDWESYAPKTIRTEISRRGRLPFEECLQLSLSLTAALSHLHKGGLVHRDIKPSNIIFVNGIPKLADIGLVADTSEAKSYVGTEGFIPPEGPGTPQADIYSLGKVLYEIATGKDRQSFPEPPTLLEEFADRGRFLELNEVIIKACETDLRARYRSAEEMHDDLVLLQTGRSVRRLRVIERRFRIAKRVGAIAAAVALLVMGILYQTTKEKARATERVIRLYVANGTRLMNEGDLFGSLLWFTQALRLDAGDAARQEPHRTRVASVLRQCPKLLNVFAHGTSLFYAEFSPDGTRLVTASDDYTARVWDVDSGKEILVLRHDGPVYHAAFSPDGRCIVTASADHTARVWDAQSGEPVSPPLRHKDTVWGAGFSPDSQTVATASADKTAQVWNFTTGEPIGPPLVHPNSVARVSFSPDGQLLAAVTVGDCAWIWETKAGRLRPFSPLKHMGTFCGVQFSPDSQRILTCELNAARVCDAITGREVFPRIQHEEGLNAAVFSPDGSLLVTASDDQKAHVYDAATGRLIGAAGRLEGPVRSADFSPDNRRIVTGGQDFSARVWDAAKGSPPSPILRHISEVKHVAFNADGRRFLSLSCDQAVRVWDLANSGLDDSPIVSKQATSQRLLNLHGDRLLRLGESNELTVQDANTGRKFLSLRHPQSVCFATYAPDDRYIVTGCSEENAVSSRPTTLSFWGAKHGQRLNQFEMEHGFWISDASFSPAGRLFAAGGGDATARVWEVPSGRPVCGPLPHDREVSFVAFSPDTRWLVTGTRGNLVRVWDVATGQPVTPPLKHPSPIRRAIFSDDKRRLYTVTWDDYFQVWDVARGEPLTPPIKAQERDDEGESTSLALVEERSSIEDLVLLAQMLTVARLDSAGNVVPLRRDELTGAWDKLKDKFREAYFSTARAEAVAWHEREASAAESNADWSAALFHLDRLLARQPGDSTLGARRAEAQHFLNAGDKQTFNQRRLLQRIGPRDPQAEVELLDLASYCNMAVSDGFRPGTEFIGLKRGVVSLGGTKFDIRGFIFLAGQAEAGAGRSLPARVEGIKV